MRGHAEVVFLNVVVCVPRELAGAAAGNDGDKAHALLDEFPREQTAAAVVVGRSCAHPVESQRLLRFARKIEHVGRLGLHAKREIVGIHARGKFLVEWIGRGAVEPLDEIERAAALGGRDTRRQTEVEHGLGAGAEHRRLINRGQEPLRIHRLAGGQRAVRIGHDNVGRQRVGFRAESIGDPRAHARRTGHDSAAEELILRGGVDDRVALARADDREVVHAGRDMRKEVGNLDAALTVSLERAFGAEGLRGRRDGLVCHVAGRLRGRLAPELVEQRFRIKRLHLARAAGHEQKDHRLRLGGQWWEFRRERIGVRRGRGAQTLRVQHGREGEAAETARGVAEKLAARLGQSRGGVAGTGAVGHGLGSGTGIMSVRFGVAWAARLGRGLARAHREMRSG